MGVYDYIYEGSGYALDQKYEKTIGYDVSAGQLGFPMKADSAAQIIEVTNALNQGIKPIEVGVMSPDVFDQIPKQHFKEINRITKLTGSKPSLHAPLIEPSGFVENNWDEMNQHIAEEHLKEVIDKAHEMDPQGNIPVTIHSSNIPGTQFVPDGKGGMKASQLVAVNQQTGKIEAVFKEEKRAYLEDVAEKGKARKYTPQHQLDVANNSQWSSKVHGLADYKKSTDELLGGASTALLNVVQRERDGEILKQGNLSPIEEGALNQLNKAKVFLSNTQASFSTMFDEAFRFSDDEGKKQLIKLAKDWKKEQEKVEEEFKGKKQIDLGEQIEDIQRRSQFLDDSLIKLNNIKPPEIYKPVEDFALEKSTDTLSNVALHGYKKYKDKAPIISLENMYPGMAYNKPEDFKKLVDETRSKFIKKAVEKGVSYGEAKRAANQTIGVTWDVGHLNLMRKQGFKEEDLIAATKLASKDIKHIHLTDNFGNSDSHLAPGMGNVPIKQILETMEKQGVDLKGTRMIVEAPAFVQHFKTSPHPETLAAFGSPIYSAKMAPYWNQVGSEMGGYFAGYGTMLPEQHFSMYGAGFSGLPTELGGQVQSGKSRMGGTPTA